MQQQQAVAIKSCAWTQKYWCASNLFSRLLYQSFYCNNLTDASRNLFELLLSCGSVFSSSQAVLAARQLNNSTNIPFIVLGRLVLLFCFFYHCLRAAFWDSLQHPKEFLAGIIYTCIAFSFSLNFFRLVNIDIYQHLAVSSM